MSQRGGTWFQRWRVPLGFLCAALFIVFARPTRNAMLVGFFVSLVGLAIRAWAAGYIRKNLELAVFGPYAFTRNPLYFGSFLLGIGFSIASHRVLLGLLFVVLFACIYVPVMGIEASTLAERFPTDYAMYKRGVPIFFPRLTPFREHDSLPATFDRWLYLHYREYRAAVGFVIAWVILLIKSFF